MDLPTKETAEVVQALTTSVALVIGGAWVFWKWSLSEYLRSKREIPSFEGKMSYAVTKLGDDRVVLSLGCCWKNVGVIPLPVNTKETRFAIYAVPEELVAGPIGPRMNNLTEEFVRRPWEHWPGAILEPGTSSDFHAHFLVPRDQTYIAMCRLEAVVAPKKQKQVRTRELVVRTSPNTAPQRSDA